MKSLLDDLKSERDKLQMKIIEMGNITEENLNKVIFVLRKVA